MKRFTKEDFIEKAIKKHGHKYDYSLVEYYGRSIKVKIICPIHEIFEQTPESHLRHNCMKCSAVNYTSNTQEFIKKAIVAHSNKYDYSLVEYKNGKSKIKIICPVHGEFEQEAASHLIGKGCIKCFAKNKCESNEEFIEKAIIVHGDKYDYSLINYENVTKKMKIICKKHGDFNQSESYHLRGIGCPFCRESKGEEKISKFLKSKNIEYEREKRFLDCRSILPLPFDFYVPEHNICIEFDGKQHFIQHKVWTNLEDIQKRDEIKNIYCKENNILLYRFNYKEIKDIDKKLDEIFI